MINHGVNVSEAATNVSTPSVAKSGSPFAIGATPVQSATSPAKAGSPALCVNWDDAIGKFGYSENWGSYPLCEFMYSHFKLYGRQPVIFCNMLDPVTMQAAVAAAELSVEDHKVKLPIEAIDDTALVVKASGGAGSAYVKGTDYSAYYDGENLVVELLSTGSAYSAEELNVAYKKVDPSKVTESVIAAGMESIEYCMPMLGTVPDLICAPGFSDKKTVAAVMATKAAGINGMFRAKALIDISTSAVGGADDYSKVAALKAANLFVDENEIACWPLLKKGNRIFHFSTQLAGAIAQTDSDNDGCPYESPSNKPLQCDAMVAVTGKEINLTLAQANMLNAAGVVTALNFMGSWTCWGNYTACYPENTDLKDYYIPLSRMFDWVGNTLIRTYWSKLDKPMSRRLIDTVIDDCNIWLNGLVGSGYLLGARVEFVDSENTLENLTAGIIITRIYLTPPSPAQEFDFILKYDASYVASVLAA